MGLSHLSRGQTFLLAVVCGVAVANVYAMQPLLPFAGRDLRLPAGADGWLVAVAQLGYLVGLVVLVPLGDVVDRRRLIAAHLAFTAVGALVTALSPGVAVAFAGLGVAGVFAVVVQTTVAYAADHAPPQRRGATMGAVTSGVVTGILGARIVAGALADTTGWRGVFVALAVMCGLAALAVLLVLPREVKATRVGYLQALRSEVRLVRGDRLVLGRGLIAFFLFASFGTLWSGLALALQAAPWHLNSTQIGLFGLAGLLGATGAARAGRWADRGRAGTVTTTSLVVLIASWGLTGLLGHGIWLLVAGVLLLDFAVQAVHVSNQHFLATAHPDRTSTVIGGYMAFYSCGSALGAITTTAAYAAGGWPLACALGAGYGVAALATDVLFRRSATRMPALPPATIASPPIIGR